MQESDAPKTPDHTRRPDDAEIRAYQLATRDLIDVAVRSVEEVAPDVSLSQLRLLLTLDELGSAHGTTLAHALGVAPSSVTRMIDRLAASGHVARDRDPERRSVVVLTLSEAGRRVVREVLAWRHDELARLLASVDPGDRAASARALGALHDAVATTQHAGWSPL